MLQDLTPSFTKQDLVPSQSLNSQVILSAPQFALHLEMVLQAADTCQAWPQSSSSPSPTTEDTRPCR